MVFQTWLARLQHPDPAVRIEALQVLAMVEETEALPAVGMVYKRDPDPAVREVARWAGRLIWEAQQRGHSTAKVLETTFQPGVSNEREELVIRSLETGLDAGRDHSEIQFQLEQDRLKREMVEAMRTREVDVSTMSLVDLAADILSEKVQRRDK